MSNVAIDDMAREIMKGLEEYSDLATDAMKKVIQQTATAVTAEIKSTAPVDTGKYASSWRSKKTSETSSTVEYIVHSPTRYQLAHLLEHGHAKRNGGRTKAIPHIAPAEEHGLIQLEKDIQEALGKG